VKAFRAPKAALGHIDAEAAAVLIATASDLALIVDDAGIIRDVSIGAQDLMDDLAGHANWVGKPWADTVMPDSRAKVAALLADAGAKGEPRWRHLNLPATSGVDVPILYAAVRAGAPGRIVVFGRDLRAVSSLQRRLVDAQQSMERDYARIRHVETRYRLLFQVATDAVLIVDGASRRIMESNPTAQRLFGNAAEPGGFWPPHGIFTPQSERSVELLLAGVQASGRADDVRAHVAAHPDSSVDGERATEAREMVVSASLFREEGGSACLIRIAMPTADPGGMVVSKIKSKLLKLMESAPDAFVVTDDEGRVVTVNAAFLELAQMPSEELVRGESLERWLGRAGVDLGVLTATLRQAGSVRLFATTLRGELGEPASVEISAVTVMNGGNPCFGFAIRDIARRLSPEPQTASVAEKSLPKSLEQMTKLIGHVALKDLVREATDVIERLCIEAALELTADNRASAAEILGLSRQSLYVKLRRYGLADPAAAT
jgi:transcriptional regulator PpsR